VKPKPLLARVQHKKRSDSMSDLLSADSWARIVIF
jgi:hypothetical protein